MGLIDIIEKVRDKPEMTRRRILVGTTFTITAIIFFFWLSIKLYNAGGPTPEDLGVKETGPISQVSSVIGDFMQSMGEKINSIKQTFSSSTTPGTISTSSIEVQ